jgi:hypothetical protein
MNIRDKNFLKWLFFTFNLLNCNFCLWAATVNISFPYLDQQKGPQGNVLPTASVGELFQIQVTVSGGGQDIERVQIEGLDQIIVHGQSQSTIDHIVNGEYSSEIHCTYEVSSDRSGVFKLGPASVAQNNQTISSKPVVLQIVDIPAVQKSKQKEGNSPHRQQTNYTNGDHAIVAHLFVNKKNIVIGESVEVVLKVYWQGPITQVGVESITFDGFLSKEIHTPKQIQETIKGNMYNVIERKFILNPLQHGKKKISPVRIPYAVQVKRNRSKQNQRQHDFFGSIFDNFFEGPRVVQKNVVSNEFIINVENLPPSNKKIDGVGVFKSFSAFLEKQEIGLNEPVILKLEISGNGNFEQLGDPSLRLSAGMKSYKSKSQIHKNLSESYMGGRKVFEFIVQCSKSGSIAIPSQEFNYFDTDHREFRQLKTEPLILSVISSGQENVPLASQSHKQEKQGQDKEPTMQEAEHGIQVSDINFIEEDISESQNPVTPLSIWIFIAFLLAPLILFFKSLWDRIGEILVRKFHGKRAIKNKLRRFNIRLETLVIKEDASQIYVFFIQFLVVKFEKSREQVTEEFIESVLLQNGWGEEKVSEFLSYLGQCASFTFASAKGLTIDKRKLLEKAKYWLLLLNE